ncbi:MATE family efflux transporter [Lepagella muris]|uniref:MATE family efflux transporter n=1 Tax=Lepagella muris TaxID=3032870 RepID=A0AC61RKJ9_9BACT|nr:MATE family efflux transporter [Lepagella muris]ROT04323.1 MATE family efflux transporter [Muribaculaceae bacterium Isolate-037 (Harlan)]TGY77823.1 MATE family efflux transporter [Lepagella muris]THG51277.1 MATE family efflux transporter [Bacteroidales bacterium]TKC64245.1 MATE family efflux transporter [Bacteroidales bacterium]
MVGKRLIRKITPESYRESYVSLVKLGLPVLVTQLGVILVNFADTMMVGAYGLDELASSAFVNSLFIIITVMLMGFAGGVTPLIGALYGKGDHEEAGRTLRGALQINVILALAFTLLMGVLYFFLDRFGQDEELLPIARPYFLILLATLLPMAVFNCFQQMANGTTDTATPMWIILGADVLNILGNYLLIFGKFGFPELGLLGAGISTLTARTLAAIAIVVVIGVRRRYRVYWDAMRHQHAGSGRRYKVWVTSYPLMIQSGVECGMWAMGAVVSGWFGKVQLAAYQVVNTIAQLGYMTYMSIGWAVSIRVANFMGTFNMSGIRRISRAGVHIILVMATFTSIIFYFFTGNLVTVFTPEPDVVAAALPLVIPLILYQYCDGVQLTYVNALRGTSVVKPLLWISIFSYIVVGIPIMVVLAVPLGLEAVGVYYSFSVALFVATVLLMTAFNRTLKREEAKIEEKKESC